jgi:carbamoyl-phosphate synthase large subunit
MCNYNFLVTSVGSFSADCTVDSLKENFSGIVYGCDIYPAEWHHISKKFEKVFRAPSVKKEADYLEFITAVCRDYSIQVIIPLTDVEVDFFHRNREIFISKNIIVTIANEAFVAVARDKKKLFKYLVDHKFDTVQTYAADELDNVRYPIIAKPANGRSSEGIFYLNSVNDRILSCDYDNYIFQEVIQGNLCTVDYIRNAQTNTSHSIPRIEWLRTKNGAGMTIETIDSAEVLEIADKIGQDLDVNGCINMEFIITGKKSYLIDINPRFSAGIAFSKIAGYDFVKNHILAFTGKEIDPGTEYKKIIAEKIMTEVINQYTRVTK